MELLLTGSLLTAEDAQRVGLVNRLVDAENLRREAETLVREIMANAPIAVSLTVEAIRRGLDLSLENSTALSADYFGLVAATEDFRAGTKAFLAKRAVSFVGK
jgi:enoyl-CoA hydratase